MHLHSFPFCSEAQSFMLIFFIGVNHSLLKKGQFWVMIFINMVMFCLTPGRRPVSHREDLGIFRESGFQCAALPRCQNSQTLSPVTTSGYMSDISYTVLLHVSRYANVSQLVFLKAFLIKYWIGKKITQKTLLRQLGEQVQIIAFLSKMNDYTSTCPKPTHKETTTCCTAWVLLTSIPVGTARKLC